MSDSVPFFSRLVLAFACFFRVLFDGALAARVRAVLAGAEPEPRLEAPPPTPPPAPKAEPPSLTPALELLALLQREGRFVDFVKQDVAGFSDADIGAAARVVHEGCRKALAGHATLEAIRSEEEGTPVTLEAGFDAQQVKLTGNVGGSAPHRGTLRHKGWRVTQLELPRAVQGHDPHVLYPAEVEL
ncbi:MAG: DUF2760 domain-containing protein [Polyangiaceae bacterium]|nr:DUF2760 domain-containing protein [Polyangiaceae bacterium]